MGFGRHGTLKSFEDVKAYVNEKERKGGTRRPMGSCRWMRIICTRHQRAKDIVNRMVIESGITSFPLERGKGNQWRHGEERICLTRPITLSQTVIAHGALPRGATFEGNQSVFAAQDPMQAQSLGGITRAAASHTDINHVGGIPRLPSQARCGEDEGEIDMSKLQMKDTFVTKSQAKTNALAAPFLHHHP